MIDATIEDAEMCRICCDDGRELYKIREGDVAHKLCLSCWIKKHDEPELKCRFCRRDLPPFHSLKHM